MNTTDTSVARAVHDVPSVSGTTRDASDGRIALRLRNRQRVIDAVIELVNEGNEVPTMTDIVERAGVSERSVFRYFHDVNDLVLTSMATVLERIQPARTIDNLGCGSFDDRLEGWVASRQATTQQTLPFASLVGRFRTTSEFSVMVDAVLAMVRAQIEDQFAPELQQCSPERGAQKVDILIALSSLEGVDILSRQLDRDVQQVGDRLRLAARSLFADFV
ncbi:MAG: TetR/AcrR family transcriptional regulator [Ilumatobacter sp.]